MGNDEKASSRKDETPTPAEKEEKTTLRAVSDDLSPLPLPMEDEEPGSEEKSAGRQSSGILEAEVGMPAFGFFHDALKQAKKAERPQNDALLAAKAALDNQRDGTGWDTIQSIAGVADQSIAPGVEISLGGQPPEARAEATVMPFPGHMLHRQTEPAPSEMLGATPEGRDANLFEAAPIEEAPDLEEPGHDTIADAVQSALRNVYGGGMAQSEEELPDFGTITVADSLKHAAAQSGEADDFWSERSEDREEAFAPRKSETDTDAVLDYLYGERRSRPQPYLSGESSLRDLGESLGYEREPRGRFEPEDDRADLGDRSDRGVLGGGRVFDEPFPGGRQYSERGQRGYGDSSFREQPVEPEWGAPPFVTSSAGPRIQDPQYPAPIANGDSLAAGSPDSSHLLGAAGLGLIGGIALAGVLAVFAFNSINVEEPERPIAEASQPVKVTERLGPDEGELAAQPADAPQPRTEAALERPVEVVPAPRPITRAEPQVQAAAPPVERIAPPPPPQPEPRLKAEDAAGDPGEAIPLDITIANSEDREATLISLKGLPVSAKLSTGIDVGGGQWLLPPTKLGNLTVTTAANVAGRFDIEAELLKDDAQTAIFGPVVFTLHVGTPAGNTGDAAPAGKTKAAGNQGDPFPGQVQTGEKPAQVASLAEGQAETDFLTQMLIRDGNKLMRDGDILAARRLYEQAAANGNPEAALAMGRSFDPSYFEKLPVKTGKPDPATAFDWYKKALDGGLVTARVKIDGLKQWLQR
jgi:hypothetical protein